MNFWQEVLLNYIAYGITLVIVAAVAGALYFLYPQVRDHLWPLPRLRPTRWSGFEVFLALMIFFQLGVFVRQILFSVGFFESRLFDEVPTIGRQLLWSTPLSFFLCLALVLGLLFGMSRTRPSHVGLTRARWPQNVVLGAVTFAVVTPVVLAIYVALVYYFGEHAHSIQEVAKGGLSTFEWGLLAFQACVAAPILEELVFRGVLQGWLRRASLTGHAMVCFWTLFLSCYPLFMALEGVPESMPVEMAWQALGFGGLLVALYAWQFFVVWRGVLREGPGYLMIVPAENAGAPSQVERDGDEEEQEEPRFEVRPERWRVFEMGNARLACLGSSMMFAVVHSFAWPSPVPLFLLALVLAWLAQRTQSLVGPIVIHAAFNTVAFGALLLGHVYGDTKGKADAAAARGPEAVSTVSAVPASQEPRFK